MIVSGLGARDSAVGEAVILRGNEPQRVVIAPHLVVRESCGAAAGRV